MAPLPSAAAAFDPPETAAAGAVGSGHVIVRAGLERLVDHLDALVRGHDDDIGGNIGRSFPETEGAAKIVAAHPAHVDVDDDELGRVDFARFNLLQRLLAA